MTLRVWLERLVSGELPTVDVDWCYDRPAVWALNELGEPERYTVSGCRVFLPTVKLSTPIDVDEAVKKIVRKTIGRFAVVDAEVQRMNEAMLEIVASALASLLDASNQTGDFTMLIHSREITSSSMVLHVSMAMAKPPDWTPGPFLGEQGGIPSPKRILSKIRSEKVLAYLEKEMLVASVMDD